MHLQDIRTTNLGNCPICKSTGKGVFSNLTDRLYGVSGVWGFYQCVACHHIWLNPQPIEDDIKLCYPTTYYTHISPTESPTFNLTGLKGFIRKSGLHGKYGYPMKVSPFCAFIGNLLCSSSYIHNRMYRGLGPQIIPWSNNGKLLDVGCGNGRYLKIMESLGWNVAGIEMDDEAASIGRDIWKLNIYTGQAQNAPFQPGSFDFVTASHLIEHLPDPLKYISSLAVFLKPGGKLMLLTPNSEALSIRIFKNHSYLLQPPQHIHLFCRNSINLLLSKLGSFSSISIQTNTRMAKRVATYSLELKTTHRTLKKEPNRFTPNIFITTKIYLFILFERLSRLFTYCGEELVVTAIRE